MACKTVRLRGSVTATTNAISNFLASRAGTIKGVQWTLQQITSVAAMAASWELSTNSTGQLLVNDPMGQIATVGKANTSTAAGGAVDSENFFQPCNYPIKAGDRLYLHSLYLTGNETTIVQCSILIEE